MNQDKREVLHSIIRLGQSGRSFGVQDIARETGLHENIVREALDWLHPVFVTLTPLPGDGYRIMDARRIGLTGEGQRMASIA